MNRVKTLERGYIRLKKLDLRVSKGQLVGFFLILFAWILAGLNTWNPDYDLYKASYSGMTWATISDSRAMGYSFLMFVFKSLGFSYQTYVALISFLILRSIYKSLKLYTDCPNLAFLAYMIYPFLIDPIQLKQWIASAIILYSLRFFKETSTKNVIKFIICVIISVLFHSSCLYYIIFILIFFIKNPYTILVGSVVTSVAFTSTALIFVENIRNNSFIKELTKGQIENYLLNENEVASKTYLFLLIGITIGVVLYVKEYGFKRKPNCLNPSEREYSDILTKASLLCIPSLSFMIVHQEFYRIFRGMFFVYYSMFFFKKNAWHVSYKKVFVFGGILIALFMYYKEFSSTAYYYEAVTKSVFENNAFFDLFK